MGTLQIWQLPAVQDTEPVSVFANGAVKSLDEASLSYIPNGVYTTFRTFKHHKVLRFKSHLERLIESAELDNKKVSISAESIRKSIREILSNYPEPEARVRITIDLTLQPGTTYISLEPFHPLPDEFYQSGVSVVTIQMARQNPRAKNTGFISKSSNLRKVLPQGIHEGLMVKENGEILEGLTSNFFAVQNEQIWTADEGVLEGITRKMVLEAARQENIPVNLISPRLSLISEYQEAFITSASRAVLPVTRIDDTVINHGVVGPVTRRLLQRYLQIIDSEVEEI